MDVQKSIMGLETIRVDRVELLNQVIANKETHRSDYEESVKGYHLKMAEFLEKSTQHLLCTMDDRDTHEVFKISGIPSVPQHHLEEYSKYIQMLQWSKDEFIYLEQHEFQNLIMDEWNWTKGWEHTKVLYNNGA